MNQKLHLLFGGSSSERLVSTASAQNIIANLPDAETWFLAKDGSVYLCPRQTLLDHRNPFKEELQPAGAPLFKTLDHAITAPELQHSVIVLALHGLGVEDGILQAKLEKAGIAFTGSGSKASALAFDKLSAKKVALQNGVRIARYLELPPGDAAQIAQILSSCIRQYERIATKPAADGSSVGLFILDGRTSVETAAQTIAQNDRTYLVEEFIAGTELTVGVLDESDGVRALPPSEVRLDTGTHFDYDAKYLGKGVEELTPARVSPEVTRHAQELAVKMHLALGCEGYSRTDLIVTREGPVYLETNTLPGMTQASFFPQQLAAAGSSIREFLAGEIARAWKSKPGR